MASNLFQSLTRTLSPVTQANLMLRAFSWAKVPMIFWTGAKVVEISDERCVVQIPFRRRNRNHLRSLYFAVFIVGADVAGGLLAFRMAHASGRKVSLAFKDVNAQFHKRAEGDTIFCCDDGVAIAQALEETFRTGERVNRTVSITATTPSKLGTEPVATFELTLSLKAIDSGLAPGSQQSPCVPRYNVNGPRDDAPRRHHRHRSRHVPTAIAPRPS